MIVIPDLLEASLPGKDSAATTVLKRTPQGSDAHH